ncbi:hypothetical protein HDV57DRAFT_518277 [Trichoderma longibrachiatum]|uniref:SWIM-type domain-containing protein n=1 Tax=Trichoderma longibrachiatum ATCC 18648 TaxID=983965 RepID=A0A2T4BQI5_TRILO|nr:hypothetical protein M440DRAFT_1395507 [Trichoderma longibrachiatum ATCC 18648]
MADDEHLPSHRQLFAALIPPSPLPAAGSDLLAGPSAAAAAAADSEASVADGLASLAEQYSNWRRQLLTLHVIFPSLLLPALDLLDRGLVSRLVVGADGEQKAAAATHAIRAEAGARSPDEHENATSGIISNNGQESDIVTGRICMYAVQSEASTTSRRRKSHAPSKPRTYAVHLNAWNCSCGSFALDAYSHYDTNNRDRNPFQSSASSSLRLGSLEAAPHDDFPCCKHLLACLLAEKWKTSPGHDREKYTITKEELAAIIGGS